MERLNPEALLAELDWLRSLARALAQNAADAEDLVQEGIAAALAKPPDIKQPVRPWLASVLRNLTRLRRRSDGRRRRRERHVVETDVVGSPNTAERVLEQVEMERLVVDLVLALPEPYRTTILLRHRDGRSAAEIAREQGVPAATVRWRLQEALTRLRAALAKAGIESDDRWCALLAAGAAPERKVPPKTASRVAVRAAVTLSAAALVLLGFAFLVQKAEQDIASAAVDSDREKSTVLAAQVLGTKSNRTGRNLEQPAGSTKKRPSALPQFLVEATPAKRLFEIAMSLPVPKDGIVSKPKMSTLEGVPVHFEFEFHGTKHLIDTKVTRPARAPCDEVELKIIAGPQPDSGIRVPAEVKRTWCTETDFVFSWPAMAVVPTDAEVPPDGLLVVVRRR